MHDELTGSKPFWDKPVGLGDVLDVGLRSAYVASWHAAPLLLRRARGLIAFTSSPGSVCYMHGPAYGAQKAGVDKMAAEQGARTVVISAAIEAEIAQLEDEEAREYMEAMGLEEPGLDRLIREGYRLLELIPFFPAGPAGRRRDPHRFREGLHPRPDHRL